jgi:hypothetical protein
MRLCYSLDGIFHKGNNGFVAWDVVFTDEFEAWWGSLTEEEQISVARNVYLLESHGPALGRPHADVIHGSRFPNMKELRVQHEGRPYRVLFIFDPCRNAVLLIGGDKTGNKRWYEIYVPRADSIYATYLEETDQS